jgi:hypothetical protein
MYSLFIKIYMKKNYLCKILIIIVHHIQKHYLKIFIALLLKKDEIHFMIY